MRYGSFAYMMRMAVRRQPAIWQIIGINLAVNIVCFFLSFGGINLSAWLSVPANVASFLLIPWTAATYMFTQTGLLHLLFNMLWLYWFGEVLSDTGGNRAVWRYYLIGGLGGAALFLLAASLIPSFRGASMSGASAAVVAVMVGAALRSPDREFHLFLIGRVKLKWLAIVSLVLLLLGLGGGGNAGGQAAHLGGALAGLILWWFSSRRSSRRKGASRSNRTSGAPAKRDRKSPTISAEAMKIRRSLNNGRSNREGAPKGDMERLDELLDKIKVSGYASLSAEEKEQLNDLSSRL